MEYLLAFLGGLVLNVMPCVFPILSLKVIALTNQKNHVRNALSYTVGVLLSFLVISLVLGLLRKAGFIVGWGYNLQSPIFTLSLSYLLFIIGLNLSGFFEVPTFSITEPKVQSAITHFFTGILAVLVATPCTAPFMATAIGYALTQPLFINLMIFQALGMGFALPFLLLAFFPKLLGFLPKPGEWMQAFREALSFPMYVSAVWLLWVAVQQTSNSLLFTALVGMILVTMSIWAWRFIRPVTGKWKHFWLIILLFINFIPIKMNYEMINASYEKTHIPFSMARLNKLIESNQRVLVVVSADWCITCKVNEQTVLLSSVVQKALHDYKVTYMMADWTKRDDIITKYLNSFDRNGVPLYILYDTTGEYKILPQILTQGTVLDYLEDIG